MRSILNCNHVFWGRGQALAGRAASSPDEAANYGGGEWENCGKSVRYARMNDAAPADRAGELVLDAKNCREAVTGGRERQQAGRCAALPRLLFIRVYAACARNERIGTSAVVTGMNCFHDRRAGFCRRAAFDNEVRERLAARLKRYHHKLGGGWVD
ncbi:MAG TPA: hypothetical protein VKC56_00180 [Gallionellaceae bacterium]|nr:hypothetical protein [Gallionellaceae bacterium]